MNCRGEENKDEIIALYELKPIAHIKLLPTQSKDGCCGVLEDRYYAFEASPKQRGHISEVFYCGDHCAKGLLKRIGHDGLPLFNLLSQDSGSGTVRSTDGTTTGNAYLCPVNKQLVNVINLLCAMWNKPPSSGIAKIIEYSYKFHDRDNERGVEWVNNLIANGCDGKTLTQIFDEFSCEHKLKVRNFNFDSIRNCMNDIIISKTLHVVNNY